MDDGNAVRLRGFGLAVLRVVVGIVFLAHGLQKLLQFGISGFAGNLEGAGVPFALFLASVVTVLEIIGGAALIVGFLTRLFALLLAGDMLVATLLIHLPNGFFVSNGGIEFTLTLLATGVALALGGSGELSVDRAVAPRGNSMLARLTR